VHLFTQEVIPMHKHPRSSTQLRRVPSQFSWVDQRLVREHGMDQLRHAACALSRFLITVAEAHGLSFYADRSLCQRLSMPHEGLHQARQALIQLGLVAYQRPLYQVFALDTAPSGAPTSASPVAADDGPVDLKAVFARIWEVLS
jgi:hypothetical protein